jgi:RNA polymerase sigma-32 factor
MITSPDIPSDSTIKSYFRDMSKYGLLGRGEERSLATRFQASHDQEALRRLVRGNLRLVVKIAKEFQAGSQAPLLDLIQEGNMGLVRAARKFDPTREVKFSYYASFWIKAYIHKYLMDNHRSVRIGTTQAQRKLFFNLKKTAYALTREGIDPTPGAIAKRLKVPEKDVIEMQQRLSRPDLSLNAPLRGREHEERIDTFADVSDSVEQRVGDTQLQQLVRDNIRRFRKQIDSRDSAILDQRILAADPATLQALGDQFGISRERIRQLEKRIIRQFKTYLSEHIPDIQDYMRN